MTMLRVEGRHDPVLPPLDLAGTRAPFAAARLAALGRLMLRYGASAAGPVAISGAHFLASFVFLRNLSAVSFGLFSFVIVAASFCMSMSGALVALPVTNALARGEDAGASLKFNWVMCAGFALLLGLALGTSHAAAGDAVRLGLFAGLFAFRWVARCLAYVHRRMASAIASDIAYSIIVMAGLGLMVMTRTISFTGGSWTLLLAALLSLAPFGRRFALEQIAAWKQARLKDYGAVFRDLTRWSLSGVVLTEMAVNAHAYLVTFIAGPGAFALLALGMLLMRPAALVQSALPDMERPAMARAIAASDRMALTRTLRDFSFGLGTAWTATILLAAAILVWFPELVLKKGYDLHDVMLVAGISAAIMLLRSLRTPPSILLQAGGAFKPLARIAAEAALVSLGATLILLYVFGTVASLGGILLGDIVILARTKSLARRWRRAHV
jgi:O-antigen/teichoic acid export membrane protein